MRQNQEFTAEEQSAALETRLLLQKAKVEDSLAKPVSGIEAVITPKAKSKKAELTDIQKTLASRNKAIHGDDDKEDEW